MKVLFTKTNFHIFLFILAAVVFPACSSIGASRGTIIAAPGALGRLESVIKRQYGLPEGAVSRFANKERE